MMYNYLEEDVVLLEEKQTMLLGKYGTHNLTGQDNVSSTLPDFTAESDPMVRCFEE